MKDVDKLILHKISIIGLLTSTVNLKYGDLSAHIRELASREYIYDGKTVKYSYSTIKCWYYKYQKGTYKALNKKDREDKGVSKIRPEIQSLVLDYKSELKSRSISTIIKMLEMSNQVKVGELCKSSIHRLLKAHNMSNRSALDSDTIERRAFEAEYPGEILYGDVLHGPKIMCDDGVERKTYLISFCDDKSRFLVYSEFYFSESSCDVENAFKESIIQHGKPKKLIVDNGSGYKTNSLSMICVRIGVNLIKCRPYEPQGKAKLERLHGTIRGSFLNELDVSTVNSLESLNHKYRAWVRLVYNDSKHSAIEMSPKDRFYADDNIMKYLSCTRAQIDSIFYYRINRKVINDGTIKYEGEIYEVPSKYVGKTVIVVVDQHKKKALYLESEDGNKLEEVTVLNKQANLNRKRDRPNINEQEPKARKHSLVDIAEKKQDELLDLVRGKNV